MRIGGCAKWEGLICAVIVIPETVWMLCGFFMDMGYQTLYSSWRSFEMLGTLLLLGILD